ncbi:MAG: tRNA pseudouridine(38-40) synthase TruA [Candidatus Eisenbacteria bacterium]
MRTFRLDIRYDGTDFAGWQVQPGMRTVQGEIERVLEKVLRAPVRVCGSGRTDAGVHALCQTADFRAETDLPAGVIFRALRGLLSEDMTVLAVRDAPEGFDSRRDALCRVYRYRIHRGRDPLLRRHLWEVDHDLRAEAMAEGAARFSGEIDATSFAASTRAGRDNRVAVTRSDLTEAGREIRYEIRANRFVHHMVRNIVGTLVDIGRGARRPDEIPLILEARDRSAAGRTAPARGLYLARVEYGADGGLSAGGGDL